MSKLERAMTDGVKKPEVTVDGLRAMHRRLVALSKGDSPAYHKFELGPLAFKIRPFGEMMIDSKAIGC